MVYGAEKAMSNLATKGIDGLGLVAHFIPLLRLRMYTA
jgi:hypothetical protein